MDHKEPMVASSMASAGLPPPSQPSPTSAHFHLPISTLFHSQTHANPPNPSTSSPRVLSSASLSNSSLTQSPHLPSRPRLSSVNNSPSITPLPANLLHIPSPRDTRNPAYTHLTCSAHTHVGSFAKNVHTLQITSLGSGDKDKPEQLSTAAPVFASAASPSSSSSSLASTATTSLFLQGSNHLHSIMPLNTCSPSHHSSNSITAIPSARFAQYHRLLVNLLTYLPPLPSDYFQINKQEFDAEAHSHLIGAFALQPAVAPAGVPLASSSPPNQSPSTSQPGTPRAVSRAPFVALNVSAATGRVFYEEKLPWPILDGSSAAHSFIIRANSSPGNSSGPNTNPSSPAASALHSQSGAGSGSSSASAFAALSRDDLPAVRRKSVSDDGEIILAIVILLDMLDIDSKQVTFIAAHRHLAIDSLFKILYKIDLTQPKPAAAAFGLSALLAPSPAIHSRVLKSTTE